MWMGAAWEGVGIPRWNVVAVKDSASRFDFLRVLVNLETSLIRAMRLWAIWEPKCSKTAFEVFLAAWWHAKQHHA